jgi:hypothetical protein
VTGEVKKQLLVNDVLFHKRASIRKSIIFLLNATARVRSQGASPFPRCSECNPLAENQNQNQNQNRIFNARPMNKLPILYATGKWPIHRKRLWSMRYNQFTDVIPLPPLYNPTPPFYHNLSTHNVDQQTDQSGIKKASNQYYQTCPVQQLLLP